VRNRTPDHLELRTRRLRGLVIAIAVIFIGRLFIVQVIEAPAINKISVAARQVTHTVQAIRGTIYDSTGKVLAKTVMKYDINAAPDRVGPVKKTVNGVETEIPVDQAAAQLAGLLGMTAADVMAKIVGTGPYVNLKKGISIDVFEKIKALGIDWVWGDPVPSRVYPSGAVAGSLLGFLTSDGVPMGGIESEMNSCLAGVNGSETYQAGRDGIKIPSSVVTRVKAVNGKDVHLTINGDLQYYAQQVLTQYWSSLRADWATAVVVEVKTGKILVAADAPTMDPNNPSASSVADRNERVFTAQFEPGSVIKALTAATLIDTGIGNPEMRIVAPYGWVIPGSNGYRVTDSHMHGKDKLTLTGVLRDSSNTGIMQLGQKVPFDTRFNYLEAFGMGKKTAVNFPGESGGIALPKSQWDQVKKYVSMFGQGFSVTPIQSAMMYQTIANMGVRLQPRLIEGCSDVGASPQDQPIAAGVRAISASSARTTIDMLEKVVEQGGIGRHAAVPGYRVGGKTGTAQIIDPATGRYGYLHAISFIGMAPAEDPQYVVAVTAFKSRTQSTSLGVTPIFKSIMQQVLRTFRIPPSTTKSANIATEWK
jgi:cell division protein FtsI (penicillin-binding protein 3)